MGFLWTAHFNPFALNWSEGSPGTLSPVIVEPVIFRNREGR
jgi:hypothetical protein